jgi:hypothetical protein
MTTKTRKYDNKKFYVGGVSPGVWKFIMEA